MFKAAVFDRFGGVTVRVERGDFPSIETFEQTLDASLEIWHREKRRGIWISLLDSHLIVPCESRGFELHHVGHDKSVTLTRWIEDSQSQLPRFATHLVGVGGLVFSKCQEKILVISERFESKMRWKLPGGLLDPGELMIEGVVREVAEETGVQSKVRGLLTMRERTDALFGVSDIYVVFVLDALSEEIKLDEREIAAAKWMRPSEVLNEPDVYPFNRGLFELAAKLTPSTPLIECNPFTAFNGNQHVCFASAAHLETMKARLV
jgi:8-oxo-dGTP diphosphatase